MDPINRKRAETLLGRVPGVTVLVVGDLMLDRYLSGLVERISPEAPVPVVRVESEDMALGGAANVAANVRSLGAFCDVVGCVGMDVEGGILLERLRELGVGVSGVLETEGRPTTVKTRIMARRQHITRVDREDASDLSARMSKDLAFRVRERMGVSEGLVLEDYNKGVLTDEVIRSSIESAGRGSVPVVVDPKRRRFFGFEGATVFKPNARELEDALGEPLQPEDPDWMASVRERLGCEVLLLTLGEDGMALESGLLGHHRVPTMALEVYDVSGAGDTVSAVMGVLLAVGASPLEAAELANHAAGVGVGKAGVATVTPAEILTSLGG